MIIMFLLFASSYTLMIRNILLQHISLVSLHLKSNLFVRSHLLLINLEDDFL